MHTQLVKTNTTFTENIKTEKHTAPLYKKQQEQLQIDTEQKVEEYLSSWSRIPI